MGGLAPKTLIAKTEKNQHDHDLRQQVPELPDALFEARLRRAERQFAGDLAEGRSRARLGDQRPRGAGTNRGSQEHRVGPFGQARRGWDGARPLLGRVGLAGQHGLVHEAVPGLEHRRVGRDQGASGEQDHVARHHAFERDGDRLPIAEHGGLGLHPLAEFLHSACGRVFLEEAEHRAAEDDDQDDPGVHPFPDEQGDGGGGDQDQQQRAAELGQEQADGGGLRLGGERVGSELLEEAGGLRGGEALFHTPSLDLRGGKIKP